MTQMIHICDEGRCISCLGCVIACKAGHGVAPGLSRRKVVTFDDGTPRERSVSVACRHCEEPACLPVCPVKAITKRPDGIVQTNKEKCISCKRCLKACPFGVPTFVKDENGKWSPQEKCTFCAGGPDVEPFSEKEMKLYGQNRLAAGKPPLCAAMCATKALLSGDAAVVTEIYEKRVARRKSAAEKP
ncbi:MAG: formate dehydrogenase [Lentisphaerae bacterium RIFOXYB12_FULL_65_16]|nr:MAG: formate dehydrogenase [Lentisphaerae bacterium RIFOXYA12_64_32]OGV91120.1 MAG: formate dehydrogenase [Lentisphaerae bacterium RIFOXYB12_FULL_65_16]